MRTSRQQGFTLVELMVAVTISLLMLAGLSTLFVSNNHAQMEIERGNRQVENGRYAMQVLTGDLRNAGYYGEFDASALTMPAALPDPCDTDIGVIGGAIALHVQGYDGANPLDCLADVREGTDIVVVRHTATCAVGDADCDTAAAGGPFLQASTCDNAFELGSGNVANYFQVSAIDTDLALHKRDCGATAGSGTAAPIRRLLTHIYFVANNSDDRDGVPTLKRAEVISKNGTVSVEIVPLADGIENMQVEYGLDTDNNGVADAYTTVPASANGCGAAACAATNWNSVVAVKVHLLARTPTESAGYQDTKSYTLGLTAAGQAHTVQATNDKYKRHVFSAMIGLPNPAGRKTS
jgi:type IV pilus assembly protein PilW